MVLHLVLGDEPLFHVPAYRLVHPVEFGVYAVLGVVGGLGSVCVVKLLLGLRAWFMRLPKSTVWIQPAVGGLAVGLMGYFVPEVLGVGYNQVEKVLNGDIVLQLVVLLAVLGPGGRAGRDQGVRTPSVHYRCEEVGSRHGWSHATPR